MPFRLLNAFSLAGDPFSGNPLAVFPDAAGLASAQMQSWARQLNLSEATFVTGLDADTCSADVRIFTPSYESRSLATPPWAPRTSRQDCWPQTRQPVGRMP